MDDVKESKEKEVAAKDKISRRTAATENCMKLLNGDSDLTASEVKNILKVLMGMGE